MSNTKYFADLIKVCSVLPVFAVVPAMADLTGNTVATNGGAIYSNFSDGETSKAPVFINDFNFINNSAKNGGAIYVEGQAELCADTACMKIVDVDFEHNKATEAGGAIYNASNLSLTAADFEYNTATKGAAVFNKGTMTVSADSEFVGNTASLGGAAIYNTVAGAIGALNAEFVSNKVHSDVDSDIVSGGAIVNGGQIGAIKGSFYNNVVSATGENLSLGNTTAKGGAIYSWADPSAFATIDSIVGDFVGNKAISSGDAMGGAITNDGKIGALYATGRGFVNNSSDAGVYAWAGALYNSQDAEIKELIANFDGNKANGVTWGAGGAVVNMGTIGELRGDFTNNSVKATAVADSYGSYGGALFNMGKIEALTGSFVNNSAFANMEEYASGGAIENMGDITLVGKNAFHNNTADYGGAIDNSGILVISGENVFSNNMARFDGGAILNYEGANVSLGGTNTFTANTANGFANDIYNDGMLTIASGVTSIDGGITGAGTLDIKSGATLNMNYASIEQGSINIDGTLMASILNSNDAVDISGMLSGSGNLLLNVGAIGTYDLGELKSFVTQDSFGKVYNVSLDENNVATLTAKDAATIAQDTGITNGAAGAVSALAISGDVKLQKVSLAVQEALNTGNAEVVEQEMAKVNPNKKPVGQSVSSSVQNQVLSLASGRMSAVGGGATTGRAGGDVTGAGVWAQGIVNKSKMGSQFEGHSAGFAMGGDTLIDNVLTLGGGYAFSDTDILGGGRDIDVESNSIFVYGQYKPAKWYVNATLTYTESEYTDVANVMGVALQGQEYDIKAYGAQAMFGYDFASGVTPEFGLRYLHTAQEEHLNSLGATVQDLDVNFLSGVAGLKYAFEIESDTAVKFSPTMRAAMTYDFLSEDAQATVVFPGATPYYVDVDSLSRMGGEFGIGLTAEWRGLELSLDYELVLHKDYTSQTGLFKFRYNF